MCGEELQPWHWRQAMQIAAQVPPDEADAWAVLYCVEEILKLSFGRSPDDPGAPPIAPEDGQLLRFPGGSRRPKRRSVSKGSPSGLPK
jgi:hypothetical protein